LGGQDEQEVSADRVGVTQYTLSAEQQKGVLKRSTTTRKVNDVDWDSIAL